MHLVASPRWVTPSKVQLGMRFYYLAQVRRTLGIAPKLVSPRREGKVSILKAVRFW